MNGFGYCTCYKIITTILNVNCLKFDVIILVIFQLSKNIIRIILYNILFFKFRINIFLFCESLIHMMLLSKLLYFLQTMDNFIFV